MLNKTALTTQPTAAVQGSSLRPLARIAPAAATLIRQTKPSDTVAAPTVRTGSIPATTLDKTLPVAAPAAVLGTVGYYRYRAADFARRNPGKALPSYYLGYGDKYAHRFTEELAPKLSPKGQTWLTNARLDLQLAMEKAVTQDPAAFAKLELNDKAFTKFAYDTHPEAYLKAGIANLSVHDMAAIAATPDLKDLLNVKGLAQVAKVGEEVAETRLGAVTKVIGEEIAVAGREVAPGAACDVERGVVGFLKVFVRREAVRVAA